MQTRYRWRHSLEHASSILGAVNTGAPSGLDINGNGKLNEAEDAWGFGNFLVNTDGGAQSLPH